MKRREPRDRRPHLVPTQPERRRRVEPDPADPSEPNLDTAGAAAAVERRLIEFVGLLGGVIALLRKPLLITSLLPVIPAVILIGVGLITAQWFPAVVAVIGLAPSAWLTVRRRQLVSALQPPAAAVRDLKQALGGGELGSRLLVNLRTLVGGPEAPVAGRQVAGSTAPDSAPSRARRTGPTPRRIAGSVWRGVKLGSDLYAQLTDIPRLAPFLPGRLRGLAFLSSACVVAAVALTVLLVLVLFVVALSAPSIEITALMQ